MLSILSLLILLVYCWNEGYCFLTIVSSFVARSPVTYSMRLQAYPSKTSQSKAAWTRHKEIRLKRANEEVRRALNLIIHSNANPIKANVYPDQRLLMATNVHDVDLTHDLSHARISINVRGNSVEKRKIYVWMCENSNSVRYALAAEIKHWKRIPTIAFTLVDPAEEMAALGDALREDEEDDEAEKAREKARLARLRAYKIANNMAVEDEPEGNPEEYTFDKSDEFEDDEGNKS